MPLYPVALAMSESESPISSSRAPRNSGRAERIAARVWRRREHSPLELWTRSARPHAFTTFSVARTSRSRGRPRPSRQIRSAQSEEHPASHLTFVRNSCRIPVLAPVSCGQFLHSIVDHFHPEWRTEPAISAVASICHDRSITEEHQRQLYVECVRE